MFLPDNLIQAFSLAVSPSARDRGVLIAVNDQIGSAFYTSKVSANRIDTFKSHEQGHLGLFSNYTPHFFFTAARATDRQHIDIDLNVPLPNVRLVSLYTDITPAIVETAVADKSVKGLVVAGFGAVGQFEFHGESG